MDDYLGIHMGKKGNCQAKTAKDAQEIFANLWRCSPKDVQVYKKKTDDIWEREL